MTDLLPALPDEVLGVATDAGQMVVAMLERAKVWLGQAVDIDDVVEAKSRAEAIRVYTVQKELGRDAELSAAEIVRRAERRIGQLVRDGQDEGTIRPSVPPPGGVAPVGATSPKEFFASHKEQTDSYAMADNVPDETFEEAIEAGKAEGNLSRANVVRRVRERVPAPPPKSATVEGERRSEWHRKARHIDPDRVVSETVMALTGFADGMALVNPTAVSPETVAKWAEPFADALRVLAKFKKEMCRDRNDTD